MVRLLRAVKSASRTCRPWAVNTRPPKAGRYVASQDTTGDFRWREVSFVYEAVRQLWPELEWIGESDLRERVTRTWVRALELSPLKPEDLSRIPFTLLIPDCPVTFMEHKRCVVHIARRAAESMREFMGRSLAIDMDTVIAGAILADVGKLLEYENVDGKTRQSERGEFVRHPFTGVALAMECGVPDQVCHIIAAHAAEGDLVNRTTEATIVHHADFMSYLPFKNLKR
jgi:putative nucleotidyltransferase with HDIG domain